MYKLLLKPFLFLFPPESAHQLTVVLLKILFFIPGVSSIVKSCCTVKDDKLKRKVFGLTFNNPVGLAAGFDKDAKIFKEFSNFGFGFIEIGTITPKPQPGNPKPRSFRIPTDAGLINRMGFNNEGMEVVAKRLKGRRSDLIIGGNIGKNKITPNEDAVNDYAKCFETLFDYVDYFVVNVSSPNTPGLRELQDKDALSTILSRLQELNSAKAKRKPILLKIAPDLTNEQLDDIISIVQHTKIDGVVATNTTINRGGLKTHDAKIKSLGDGGLSGKPLTTRATEVIRYLAEKSNKAFPIIGVGGIHSPEDAIEKIEAGADLVQIFTGFIYQGPSLIKSINKRLLQRTSN